MRWLGSALVMFVIWAAVTQWSHYIAAHQHKTEEVSDR